MLCVVEAMRFHHDNDSSESHKSSNHEAANTQNFSPINLNAAPYDMRELMHVRLKMMESTMREIATRIRVPCNADTTCFQISKINQLNRRLYL